MRSLIEFKAFSNIYNTIRIKVMLNVKERCLKLELGKHQNIRCWIWSNISDKTANNIEKVCTGRISGACTAAELFEIV